jgi:hypothetical protein
MMFERPASSAGRFFMWQTQSFDLNDHAPSLGRRRRLFVAALSWPRAATPEDLKRVILCRSAALRERLF